MANNLTDVENDLEGIILDYWGMEIADPEVYVTVDNIQPAMAERGYHLSRKELADKMVVIAHRNRWPVRMKDDGTVETIPLPLPPELYDLADKA